MGKLTKQLHTKKIKLKTLAKEIVEEKCSICSKNHNIHECEGLKKLTTDGRLSID